MTSSQPDLTHFDHERIVHARGSGAHGYFELEESMSQHTTASFLQKKGERTPVFARFSTVVGGAGSGDMPRDMRGFAVKFYTREGVFDLVGNTFLLVNAQDRSTFVKFHWRPKLGTQSVLWDEAVKLNGADPDFHRRDLFNAISSGDFPEWEFSMQLFTEEQARSFDFDVLDPTKLIPEEVVPLTKVGRMILVKNFFAETEQVAFCPANVVPGIEEYK